MPDFNSKNGVSSGTYYIVVEDSDTPDIFVKFTGFSSPKEASNFIYWLEEMLLDSEDKVIH